jgi:two-component system response regulator HydG
MNSSKMSSRPGDRAEILVVDDDRDFAESLADLLEQHGYAVDLAHSGDAAITKFEAHDYYLALLDVKMPGKNGVESFLEIRKIRPHARCIMMTGYSMPELLDQALANGAWAVVPKPLDIDKILAFVRDAHSRALVLIADDDVDFVASLQVYLERAGYRVKVATDGQQAVEIVTNDGIDILILDLKMPLMNGIDVCLELKRRGYQIPTVVVSAYANDEQNASQLRALEVTGILQKPFDPADLLKILDGLVRHGDPAQ